MRSATPRSLLVLALALLAGCAAQPAQRTEPGNEVPVAAIPAALLPESPAAGRAAAELLPPPPIVAAALAPRPAAEPLHAFTGDRRELDDPLRGLARLDRTARSEDLWQRMRQGFSMPDLSGPLVQSKVDWYLNHPDYMQRVFERSRKYLYYVVDELEKRGMPMELALLPMIESSYNPMAYSRAHASGLWQFIPPTGKRYSLQQNWWYDARRDVLASTEAALDYLEKLYEMHGDWHLALAAYNWGENAVRRAMDRNAALGRPTDYQSLQMPRETRHYIPKLQAMKDIILDPRRYGVELEPIPNRPYFAAVENLPAIDVLLAARLAQMPVEDFIALNPAFSRPLIPANYPSRIIVPADKVDLFRTNLDAYDADKLVSWKSYRRAAGETLEAIARKFSLSANRLKEVNGITPRARDIPPVLLVPVNSAAASVHLPLMYAPPPVPRRSGIAFHIIRAKDTLPAIARRYGVSTDTLLAWNPGAKIVEGQRLTLWLDGRPRRAQAAAQARR